MLRKCVDLIERFSFESSKITTLKKHFHAKNARNLLKNSKSLFVINDVEIKKKRRCELLNVKKYLKDNKSFFINYLYNVNKK